jgi:hypothetical protein
MVARNLLADRLSSARTSSHERPVALRVRLGCVVP